MMIKDIDLFQVKPPLVIVIKQRFSLFFKKEGMLAVTRKFEAAG